MIEDILTETKAVVWPQIQKYLKDPPYPPQFVIPKKFKPFTKKFWEINKVYPERKGKYLRPTLVLLTASAMGMKLSKKLILTAAAMQLSEEWILIHDDIEDKSFSRRGAPTLHELYGLELALNAGDALQTIMWKMISDIDDAKITKEFHQMLLRTELGQGVEQIWTNSAKKLTNKEYFFIADSKSAYYSIAGPMRLGAILANVTNDQLNKITNFGLHLGRCFQLIDDILDCEEDKKEKKATLTTLKGKAYARRLAQKEASLAQKIFRGKLKFLSQQPARNNLEDLTEFIVNRKY